MDRPAKIKELMEGPATSGVRLLGEDGNPLTLGLLRRGTTVHMALDGLPVSFGCLGPTAHFGVQSSDFLSLQAAACLGAPNKDFVVFFGDSWKAEKHLA